MRAKLNALTVAVSLAVVCGCATAPESASTVYQDEVAVDGYIQIVEPVADGVHLMRQAQPNFAGVLGNVVIIEQPDSIVLVDSAGSYGSGARVVQAVRALSPKPVSAVIVTHWHNDHPLGLSAIVEAWPDVSIISTEATREALAAGLTRAPTARDPAWETQRRALIEGAVEEMRVASEDQTVSQQERDGYARALSAQSIRLEDAPGTYVVMPNRTFRDRLMLDDERTPVEVRFEGRANTDGDAEIWLPRQRILIAGDAVVWPVPYNFNMYPADNIETLQRLRAINFDVLIPGHGEMLHDRNYLDLLIAFTRDVRTAVAPLAQSATLEEVTAQLTMDDYTQRFAGDDPWLRYWFAEYSLKPLIESAYEEARGEPLGPPPVQP